MGRLLIAYVSVLLGLLASCLKVASSNLPPCESPRGEVKVPGKPSAKLFGGVSVGFSIAHYCFVNALGPLECLAVSNVVRGSGMASSLEIEGGCEVRARGGGRRLAALG